MGSVEAEPLLKLIFEKLMSSIIKGYPDYMTLRIMYTIKKYPNTTYNDLVMKNLDLPKLAVKVILTQLFKAGIVYKDSPEDNFFQLTTKGRRVWAVTYDKVLTQFYVLDVFGGRNGMTLDEISDELHWKRDRADRFLTEMWKDGLLTFLNPEEASRRDIRNSMLLRYLATHPFEYLAITPKGKQLWGKLRKLPYLNEL